MNINPGELNKKITIVLNGISQEKDADGFPVKVENEEVRSCWASFKRTSGTEKVKAGREMAETECRFLVRQTSTVIDTSMQIKYAGDTYNILYTNDYNDSHEYMEIWCRKVE